MIEPPGHQIAATLMRDSYRRLTGKNLLDPGLDAHHAVDSLMSAPFAALSHDTAGKPKFNYANRQAMSLFEMEWNQFIGLPSHLSAEPQSRQSREELLKKVTLQGFIDDYSGIRISRSGRRFQISNAVVWNLLNVDGQYFGQAAVFDRWTFLSG